VLVLNQLFIIAFSSAAKRGKKEVNNKKEELFIKRFRGNRLSSAREEETLLDIYS
jgi:uncharacterized protein YifE (UPF0438 family)